MGGLFGNSGYTVDDDSDLPDLPLTLPYAANAYGGADMGSDPGTATPTSAPTLPYDFAALSHDAAGDIAGNWGLQSLNNIAHPLIQSQPLYTPLNPAGLTEGNVRIEQNPALAGVNDYVRSMIGHGALYPEVRNYLDAVGVDPKAVDGLSGSDPSTNVFLFRDQHPEVPVSNYNIDLERRQVQMTPWGAGWNRFVQSPVGTFGLGYLNGLSMDTLSNFAPNPDQARAGFMELQEKNPLSALAGKAAGVMAASTIGGRALELSGLGQTLALGEKFKDPLVDAVYGTIDGYNANPDHPLGGAVLGGMTAVGGGVLARGIPHSLGAYYDVPHGSPWLKAGEYATSLPIIYSSDKMTEATLGSSPEPTYPEMRAYTPPYTPASPDALSVNNIAPALRRQQSQRRMFAGSVPPLYP